jgi:hypothetical protein
LNEATPAATAAMIAAPTAISSRRDERRLSVFDSQHFLNFRPLPQGHWSFRPGFAIAIPLEPRQSTARNAVRKGPPGAARRKKHAPVAGLTARGFEPRRP